MNRKLLFILLIATLPFAADAQFNGILNKVKNKAKQRADNTVDKETDKTLDEIEGSTKKSEPASTPSAPSASKTENKEEATAEEPALKSYTKYDFIPGDQILYYDNFEGEALAELPTGWNTSGTGEVTTFEKYQSFSFRL